MKDNLNLSIQESKQEDILPTLTDLVNSLSQMINERANSYNQGLQVIQKIVKLSSESPEDTLIFLLLERLKSLLPVEDKNLLGILKQAQKMSPMAQNMSPIASKQGIKAPFLINLEPEDSEKDGKPQQKMRKKQIQKEYLDSKEFHPWKQYLNSLTDQDTINSKETRDSQEPLSEEPQSPLQSGKESQAQRKKELRLQQKEEEKEQKAQQELIELQQEIIKLQQEQIYEQQRQQKSQQVLNANNQEGKIYNQLDPNGVRQQGNGFKQAETNYALKQQDWKNKYLSQIPGYSKDPIIQENQPSSSATQPMVVKPLTQWEKTSLLADKNYRLVKKGVNNSHIRNFDPLKKIKKAKILHTPEEHKKYQAYLERIILFEENYNMVVPEKFKNIIFYFKRTQNDGIPVKSALDEEDEKFVLRALKILGSSRILCELLAIKRMLLQQIKKDAQEALNKPKNELTKGQQDNEKKNIVIHDALNDKNEENTDDEQDDGDQKGNKDDKVGKSQQISNLHENNKPDGNSQQTQSRPSSPKITQNKLKRIKVNYPETISSSQDFTD